MSELNIMYAIKDGNITHISEVESGIKCGCNCPACNTQLIAQKGEKMIHHFAHSSGKNCKHGYETSLHLAAKQILSKSKIIVTPPVFVTFPDSNKKDELIIPAKKVRLDYVELEKRVDSIIPDVIAYCGEKKFLLEIFVTHSIDEEKRKKLHKIGIATIELNLSKCEKNISDDELSDILLNDSDNKAWKYNPISEKYLELFYSNADKKN